MEKELHKAAVAFLAAVVLGSAGCLAAAAAAAPASAQGAVAPAQECHTVKVKRRVKRWVWVPKTFKRHGHRAVVRAHGKIVYVHVRVWRKRTRTRFLCTPSSSELVAAPAPLAPAAALVPASELVGLFPQPPVDIVPPVISGIPEQGQELAATPGSWSGAPTAYGYQWMRCDGSSSNCYPISPAASPRYTAAAVDVGHELRVNVVATNAVGPSAPASSAAIGPVLAPLQPPLNRVPPAISGAPEQGHTLAHIEGSWANEPTSEADQWLRCESTGKSCQPISGATAETYVPVTGDVGSRLKVQETASNSAGASAPATSAPSEVVTAAPQPPTDTSPPAIGGVAQEGQRLSASTGSWTGSPTGFAYEWLRCDSQGSNCAAIVLANTSSYNVVTADVGSTLRVSVVASNGAGSSAPATSAQTEVVTAAPQPPTNTSPPAISGIAQQGQTLTASPGSWTNNPTAFGYKWKRCNESGASCTAILGANSPSLALAEADVGHTLRVSVTASNSAGASAPATSPPSEVVTVAPQPPTNTSPPAISGLAQQGQTLTASPGSWTGSPGAFSYQWQRCDAAGTNCAPIASATTSSYSVVETDVGSTLRVAVTAANAAGSSAPATSAPSEVVTGTSTASHLEYVFAPGTVHVYSIDKGFAEIESLSLPDSGEVRGVEACPATGVLYVSYGGQGGGSNGSALAYSLLIKEVLWQKNYSHGVDSFALSKDCTKLYMPVGEYDSSGEWKIVNTATGEDEGSISTPGSGGHDGTLSFDGKLLVMGEKTYSHLVLYHTEEGKVQAQSPALVNGVRPNTINGADTEVFTTASSYDGFQVSSTAEGGAIQYTENFNVGGSCSQSTCSHGISLSPDNKEVAVVDAVHNAVQFWNVEGVEKGVAPVHVATVPVTLVNEGWVQHSYDGRYVFVGDSGDVISTATHTVVAHLASLEGTRQSLEVDWEGARTVATTQRVGVGR
jgi:hypothetical protein